MDISDYPLLLCDPQIQQQWQLLELSAVNRLLLDPILDCIAEEDEHELLQDNDATADEDMVNVTTTAAAATYDSGGEEELPKKKKKKKRKKTRQSEAADDDILAVTATAAAAAVSATALDDEQVILHQLKFYTLKRIGVDAKLCESTVVVFTKFTVVSRLQIRRKTSSNEKEYAYL